MNPWVAIVGTRDSGRKDAVGIVVDVVREAGPTVGGIVQVVIDQDGEDFGYDAIDLDSGDRVPIAREAKDARMCRWGFDPEGFAVARNWALKGAPFDVVVLEAGSLEANGEGHWPTILEALEGERRLVVLSIRPSALARIGLELPDPADGIELPAEEDDIRAFGARIAKLVPST
jgi:nucleoside-triphosphatase THEP1